MIRAVDYSTEKGLAPFWDNTRPMDLDDSGALHFMAPCKDMVSASAQVRIVEGTGSAFQLTVIVSNHPSGALYENHPSAIVLTNSAKISQVFSVAGYLWFGVKLTTVNSGNATGHIYLVAKDSPA